MKNDVKFRFVALMGALALVGAGCVTAPNGDGTMVPADDAMQGDGAMKGDEGTESSDEAMMEGDHMDGTATGDDAMGGDAMQGGNMEDSSNGDAMMEGDHMDDGAAVGEGAQADANVKVFTIGGKNFEYDVTEMRVKKGDTVKVVFTATSGMHDWNVDEFNAHTEKVRDGGTSEVTFVADKAGTFEYYCSVGQHRANGMVGTLIVE